MFFILSWRNRQGELTSIIPNNIMADDPDSDLVFYRFISGEYAHMSASIIVRTYRPLLVVEVLDALHTEVVS